MENPLPSSSEGETRECGHCGATVRSMPNLTGSGFVSMRCECEVRAWEAEREAFEDRQRTEAIERYFGQWKIPGRFTDRRLDTFRPVEGSKQAYEITSSYIKTLDERIAKGHGVILWGTNGNGKSHLAASIYHAAKEAGKSAIFAVVPDVLSKLKGTFDGDAKHTLVALTDPLVNAKLLVLDDLGQEKGSEWVVERLFIIINGRYEARRSTIVTTNQHPDQLASRIGKASLDRLTEMCRFVELTAPSERFKAGPKW